MLRLTMPGDEPWDIAIGWPGWYRTPNPRAVAFVSDGTGYLIDVPTRAILRAQPDVVRITEDEVHGLLLMLTDTFVTAIGSDAVVWESDQLALDDLKVVAIDNRGIVCTGYTVETLGGVPAQFVLDAHDGSLLTQM